MTGDITCMIVGLMDLAKNCISIKVDFIDIHKDNFCQLYMLKLLGYICLTLCHHIFKGIVLWVLDMT